MITLNNKYDVLLSYDDVSCQLSFARYPSAEVCNDIYTLNRYPGFVIKRIHNFTFNNDVCIKGIPLSSIKEDDNALEFFIEFLEVYPGEDVANAISEVLQNDHRLLVKIKQMDNKSDFEGELIYK